jgi:outer membrane protein OmpA-like peptidoglycan-associated protein
MPDQDRVKAAVKTAAVTFGEDMVQNDLSVGDAITKPGWLDNLHAVIKLGPDLKEIIADIDVKNDTPASIAIANRRLTITGMVLFRATRQKFGDTVMRVSGLGVDNQLFAVPITFEFAKFGLDAEDKDTIEKLVPFLEKHSDFEVEGHTDNAGDYCLNLKLSQNRANAVRDYLIEVGMNEEKITARGYSDLNPLQSNKILRGRQRNRRIEFRPAGEPPVKLPKSQCP